MEINQSRWILMFRYIPCIEIPDASDKAGGGGWCYENCLQTAKPTAKACSNIWTICAALSGTGKIEKDG